MILSPDGFEKQLRMRSLGEAAEGLFDAAVVIEPDLDGKRELSGGTGGPVSGGGRTLPFRASSIALAWAEQTRRAYSNELGMFGLYATLANVRSAASCM